MSDHDTEPDFLEEAPPAPPPDDVTQGRIRIVVLPHDPEHGLGFSLQGSGPTEVFAVAPGSLADSLGVIPGEVVLSINATDVSEQPHDVVAEVIARCAPSPIELSLLSRQTPKIAVMETSSSTSLRVEQLQDVMDAAPPIGDAERECFKPFSSLDLLAQEPAHLAIFLHYLLSNGILIEEMLCYLSIRWLRSRASKANALIVFEDFVSTTAPLQISGLPPALFNQLEQTLNMKGAASTMFTEVFDQVAEQVIPPLNLGLAKFEELVFQQLGSLYGVNRLVSLTKNDQPALLRDLLEPHLIQTMQCGKDMVRTGEVVADCLIELLTQVGVKIDAEANERSTRRRAKLGKRKVRLHAGHHFVTSSYQHPTFCGVCKTLLWGVIKQGWDCVDCGFHVHKSNDMTGHRKCHLSITQSCLGTKQKKTWNLAKYPKKIMRSRSTTREKKDTSPSSSRRGTRSNSSRLTSSMHDSLKEPSSPGFKTSGWSPSPSASIRSNTSTATVYDETLEFELPCDLSGQPENWIDTISDEKLVKKLDSKETSRQNIIYELIQTERGYFRHLHILQQLFRQPLMDDGLLPSADLVTLFSNVDELVAMNRPLYNELSKLQEESTGQPVSQVGEAFLEGFSKIDPQAYAVFCSNQTLASQFYQEKKASYAAFKIKIKQCEAHPVAERLSYTDFIAKPLQRLTKYPLLLKGILKCTNKKDTKEIEALHEAQEKADSVLRYVQAAVRKMEDSARLRELNKKIDSSMASSHEANLVRDLHLSGRQLVKEGMVQVRVQDKLVDVQAVLLTDLIILLQPKEDKYLLKIPATNAARSPVVLLGSVVVRGVATDPRAFFVISTSRVGVLSAGPQMYEFVASTKRTASEWMESISSTAEAFKKANPDWNAQQMAAVQAEAEGDVDDDASDSDADEEVELEMTLGQLIEQMRHNCEINRQLLGRVNQALSTAEFQSDAVPELQPEDNIEELSREFPDDGAEQSASWLTLQLARTMERCTSMQTKLAELGVQLYAAREGVAPLESQTGSEVAMTASRDLPPPTSLPAPIAEAPVNFKATDKPEQQEKPPSPRAQRRVSSGTFDRRASAGTAAGQSTGFTRRTSAPAATGQSSASSTPEPSADATTTSITTITDEVSKAGVTCLLLGPDDMSDGDFEQEPGSARWSHDHSGGSGSSGTVVGIQDEGRLRTASPGRRARVALGRGRRGAPDDGRESFI
eukprot:m.50341 g.50341  ORF g.50341 m.50341 type:complete len:1209 (+) comp12147_c1_seq1:446-4072(+)